jgi:hypothetical protein
MAPIDPQRDPSSFAIASGAILAGLLDLLNKKEILTISEVRGVLNGAMRDIGPRIQTPSGLAASQIIQELLGQFSERNV